MLMSDWSSAGFLGLSGVEGSLRGQAQSQLSISNQQSPINNESPIKDHQIDNGSAARRSRR
jgi:hypothetical protein